MNKILSIVSVFTAMFVLIGHNAIVHHHHTDMDMGFISSDKAENTKHVHADGTHHHHAHDMEAHQNEHDFPTHQHANELEELYTFSSNTIQLKQQVAEPLLLAFSMALFSPDTDQGHAEWEYIGRDVPLPRLYVNTSFSFRGPPCV